MLRHVSCSIWNPPGLGIEPGIEPVSPTLAGKYLTTGPPGKFRKDLFIYLLRYVSTRTKIKDEETTTEFYLNSGS